MKDDGIIKILPNDRHHYENKYFVSCAVMSLMYLIYIITFNILLLSSKIAIINVDI